MKVALRPFRQGAARWMLVGIFAAGVSAAPLSAQPPLTREAAISSAFRHNKELSAAKRSVDLAKSKLRWSGRLENPELELSYSDDGAGRDANEGVFEVGISQAFPLTSRLKDEKKLRRYQVILAEAEIAERRRQLAGEVDLAFVELLVVKENIERQRHMVTLNEKIISFLNEQVKVGEASVLDATQAKLTGRTLEQQIKALSAQETAHELALKKLMGMAPSPRLRVEGSLQVPSASPKRQGDLPAVLERRPDHLLSVCKIDEAEAAIALETAKRWEDVDVRLFAERERTAAGAGAVERNSFVGVGVSIPLPLRKRNQDGIEESRIHRERAGQEKEAVRFKIQSELEAALSERYDAWQLARETSGELLSLADKNFNDFQKAYEEGQASLLQVLRAQEQQISLRAAAVELAAEYHRSEARLRQVEGRYTGLSSDSSSQK